jgi:hypothetical protein
MNKEELASQGWEVTYSGESKVGSWGKWIVHLRYKTGHTVFGYGSDEGAAINDAAKLVNK